MALSSDISSSNPGITAQDPAVCKLDIQGDISGQRVNSLENEITETMTSGKYKKVLLNLSGSHNMDSNGIALCVGIFKECKMKNIELEIIASNDIMKLFRIINLDRVLPVTES